jgi:hypothetical protein
MNLKSTLTHSIAQSSTTSSLTKSHHCHFSIAAASFRFGFGVAAALFRKKRAATGIEPVTSCTRNRNHATRPSGHGNSW